jgi:hypothetical protein
MSKDPGNRRKPKTSRERADKLRANRHLLGIYRREVYAHDDDWPEIKALAAKRMRKHTKKRETMMTDQATPAKVQLADGLGPTRDAVLRELDDATNQTWRGKRARWAALVRAQESEIARLRNELNEVLNWARIEKAPLREQEIASIARVLGLGA